jgi:hypothetical protein
MIEIIVNGTALELDNVDLQITKSIADIREPQTRQSEWSKTIVIPGTKRNNKLFNQLFEVGKSITQFQFNPNKKAPCMVLVDGAVHLEGFIRLTEVIQNDGQVEYNATIHGQLADLFNDIKNLKLADLDFSEYNHVLNRINVLNSWDTSIKVNNVDTAFEYGKGYVYSQILPKKATQNNNIRFWRVDDHVPCLYAKTIVDKIFEGVGYQYTADSFFNSERFKRLIIPYTNTGFEASETQQLTRLYQAQLAGNITLNSEDVFPASNDSTGGNFDNGTNYNTTTYKYTAPIAGNYEFYLALKANYPYIASDGTPATANFRLKVNGVYSNVIQFETQIVSNVADFEYTQGTQIQLTAGDEVELVFGWGLVGGVALVNSINMDLQSYWFNRIAPSTFFYNNAIDFLQFFSGSEYTQSELISNFIKMFNLYVDATDSKTLRFVTRDEFYNGVQVDWSAKLDYDQPTTIIPMGDLQANPYIFTFKEGKDIDNTEYKAEYNRTYGDRIVRVDNDFVKEEKKIEVSFVPTLMRQEQDKFYSVVDSKEKTGELRVLYYGGIQATSAYKVYETTTTSVLPITTYPLTLHIDSVSNMQLDLNFGTPKRVDVAMNLEYSNQNLVNEYYYRTISEIADKDSKLFKGYFRITKSDWVTLQFSDIYFFEGQFWRLQRIDNYNPDIDGTYLCEFSLVKYYEPASVIKKDVGLTYADAYGGGNPIGEKINRTGSDYRGVYIGNNFGGNGDNIVVGDLNNIGGTHNSVFGSQRTQLPQERENTTLIRCEDFAPTKDGFYFENYEMNANWLSGGKVVTVTSNYQATKDDWLIACDTSGGNITITLPDATLYPSKMFTIKKVASNHSVTIETEGGQIDGSPNHTITNNNGFDTVVSDGNNYLIISEGH